jgi:hypothetical protein
MAGRFLHIIMVKGYIRSEIKLGFGEHQEAVSK